LQVQIARHIFWIFLYGFGRHSGCTPGSSNDGNPLAVYQKNMDASRKENAMQRNVAWRGMGVSHAENIPLNACPFERASRP
jgi:hypothetical protein